MRPLINNTVFLIALTLLGGCVHPSWNTPSSTPEPQEPEKIAKQLPPPLLSGGKKPLLIEKLAEKVDFPPVPKEEVQPCVDARTGKAVRFLLADLNSELISLSYSGMERILTSLQVMGLKTIEATGPIARPYTVNRKGKATMLPAPKLTHDKIGYTCSELHVFYKLL